MHSPSTLEESLKNSRRKSPHISYRATAFGKLCEPFYTTVSPCTLNDTTAISRTIGVHTLAVIPDYLHTMTLVIHPRLLPGHQVVRKSYTLHAACGYRIKLQRQEYTERLTYDRI